MKLRRIYPAGVVAEWLWMRLNCLIQQQAWVVDGPEKVSPTAAISSKELRGNADKR